MGSERPYNTAGESRSPTTKPRIITLDRFDAVLFDLDGVLTDTAAIHAACWKLMFDDFLRGRTGADTQALRPFDDEDYRLYVDGKPRADGVRDFLASRGVQLPEGAAEDPTESETVFGLGSRKNELVNREIERRGVQAYPGSVAWLKQLRAAGFRAAVVSASTNARVVLRAAGLAEEFEVLVDGNRVSEQGLLGKPAPDSFLEAARELGVEPVRAVVVEDALSGVQAGRAGGFGMVIGVARKDDAESLAENGADMVVADLAELVA